MSTCDPPDDHFLNYRGLAQWKQCIDVAHRILSNLIRKEEAYLYTRIVFPRMTDINYVISSSGLNGLKLSNLLGYTALHFAAESMHSMCTDMLLSEGVNVCIKNFKGQTPLHLTIYNYDQQYWIKKYKLNTAVINSLLSWHIKTNNAENPKDENGISHFHIACMVNNTEVVEFFLKNGISVDEVVNVDSSFLPGFGPLHFAARYCCLETVKMLLKYNARVDLKDARGMTPLHVVIERNKETIDSVNFLLRYKMMRRENDFKTNESIMDTLIKKNGEDFKDEIGITYFHVACMKRGVVKIKNFFCLLKQVDTYLKSADNLQNIDINSVLNMDSQFCPGYSALHFAAHFNIDTVFKLVHHGADVAVKDAKGITPMDLCLERYSSNEIYWILNKTVYKDLKFSDDTKVSDYLLALKSKKTFFNFIEHLNDINIFIPLDSLIWPGLTLSELCFYFERTRSFYKDYRLFTNNLRPFGYEVKKFVDPENSFYLSLMCISRDQIESGFKQYLQSGLNVNTPIGAYLTRYSSILGITIKRSWTPLQIAVIFNKVEAITLLLENGADPFLKDEDGFTSIHLGFISDPSLLNKSKTETLIKLLDLIPTDKYENSVTKEGLSHLHIACYIGHKTAVMKLLKHKADAGISINIKLNKFCEVNYANQNFQSNKNIDHFVGNTPLHLAAMGGHSSIFILLIEHGAEINVKNGQGVSPFWTLVSSVNKNIVEKIYNLLSIRNSNFKKWVYNEKITPLHVACYANNASAVENLLKLGADVNIQIDSKSPIWPGKSPVHLLLEKNFDRVMYNSCNEGWTYFKKEAEGNSANDENANENKDFERITSLLLKSNSKANLIDANGLSHLHIACTIDEPSIVEEYLKCGANVNESVDHFSKSCPGCTPLHFAAFNNCPNVVRLLLSSGADVRAEDRFRATPLHLTADEHVIEIILSDSNVNVNARDVYGKTPLENNLSYNFSSSSSVHQVINIKKYELLLKHGADINTASLKISFYPTCNIATAFKATGSRNFNVLLDNVVNLTSVDDNGFNLIHNIVACEKIDCISKVELIKVIDILISRGCELDHQANNGKTPLHIALYYENVEGICALIALGADVTIADNTGTIPIVYIVENSLMHEANVFLSYFIRKLKAVRLDLGDLQALRKFEPDAFLDHSAYVWQGISRNLITFNYEQLELEISKLGHIKVDETFTMRDFLTDAVVERYETIPAWRRQAIDDTIKMIDESKQLPELFVVVKFQRRRGMKRLKLLKSAKPVLQLFTGLPDLCCQNICLFLTNEDFKVIISAIE